MFVRISWLGRIVLVVLTNVLLVSVTFGVNIETITVVNPGNIADSTTYGSVDYIYNIGKYEVTVGQYTEFLNAVAATDTYGLYHLSMQIHRSGSSGSYTYSPAAGWENRPVTYVCWGDAARFANWLHNGQPIGAQDLTTTEDGAYFLNGAISKAALMAVSRETDWMWAITSENEWYKAAYHMADHGVAGDYWTFPTSNNNTPGITFSPDPGNNANYYKNGYTIGSPYFITEVGEFENSPSPYGTFDQGGNVWEWNEGVRDASSRGIRGGSYGDGDYYMAKSYRGDFGRLGPDLGTGQVGFRVCQAYLLSYQADLDGNGTVDLIDLSFLFRDWLLEGAAIPEAPNGDINKNGKVDLNDFAIFARQWN